MNDKFLNMKDTISTFKNQLNNAMLDDMNSFQRMYNMYMFEYNMRKQDSLELAVMRADWDLREDRFHRSMTYQRVLAFIFCLAVVFLR